MQPGVGQLHLRLDAGRVDQPESGGLGDQGAQQLGLADARLAPDHHDGALAVAHVGDELPEDLQLFDSAEQPGRRMHTSPTPTYPVCGRARDPRSLCRAGPVPPRGPDAGQDDEMDSHDGQRDPDSALILDGIRALHNRLDELEHRASPAPF